MASCVIIDPEWDRKRQEENLKIQRRVDEKLRKLPKQEKWCLMQFWNYGEEGKIIHIYDSEKEAKRDMKEFIEIGDHGYQVAKIGEEF
jgi:hypothetical protein